MIASGTTWLVRIAIAVVGIAFVLVAGCGGRAKGAYKVAPVHGTVTYNGVPLEGATVMFYPADQGLPPAGGTTDASGNYQLMTYFNGADGAVLGTHKVAVRKRAAVEASQTNAPPNLGEARLDELREAAAEQAKPAIPLRYFGPESSMLVGEVAEGKKNVINFDLKD